MDPANAFVARLIERGAGAYAGLAAARYCERDPAAAERFAPEAFEAWREQLQRFLAELAAAVADGLPQRFAQRVAWTRDAFAARAVPSDDLRASLRCLREVLEEELPSDAAAVLAAYFELALESARELATSAPALPSQLPTREPARSLCVEYLAAIGAGDTGAAASVAFGAVRARGSGVLQVLCDVLAPAQVELGRLWHAGEIGIAEEHFGSATTRRVMHQLLALAPLPEPTGKSVLVAVAAGDLHDLGAAIVAAAFELDGWRALHFGADLPAAELRDAVARFDVDLVALSATIETQRRRAGEAIAALRRESLDVPVLVGGAAFQGDEGTWRNAGADAFALDARDAVRQGRALVGLPARA